MNESKSQFGREYAIVPTVAKFIAGVAFCVVQIILLVLVPRYVHSGDVPHMPWLIVISVVGGFFLGVIILMTGYVNADSRRRGMNPLLWTLLVIFIPKALGFIAYFLLRKPLVMPCPQCGTAVGSDFRYCQKCGYTLAPTCAHCGRAIQRDYVCCPYCGKTVGGAPLP